MGGEGRGIELVSGGRRECLSIFVDGLNAGAPDCPPVNMSYSGVLQGLQWPQWKIKIFMWLASMVFPS